MANTLKFGKQWAVKKGSALAYNDENNNFKPLPFTFDRDSSATRVNKDGLIETVGSGEPRVDYTDSAEGAMLLEPSRTNRITNSNDFTTNWSNLISGTGVNPIVTSNQDISPDGTLNADKVVFNLNGGNTSSDYSLLDYSLSGFSNPHTLDTSIYLKSSDGNNYQVAIYNRGTSVQIITVTNQWQRFSVNGIRSNTTNNFRIGLFGHSSSNTASLLLFGSQAELGSYPTSYIPTQGSVQTRNSDSCLQGGFQDKNIFGSTQGSAVFEFKWDIGSYVFDFSDALGIRIRIFDGNTDWKIRDYTGASWVNTGFSKSNNVKTKIAFKWNGTQFTSFQDGVKSSSTDGFASSLSIERITTNKLNNVSNMQFYNTALTDQELINLTTI